MKRLSYVDYRLCSIAGKIFEASTTSRQYSSAVFIRRFMLSNIATLFESGRYLMMSNTIQDVFDELDEQFGQSTYGKEKYPAKVMYWVGYTYIALARLNKLSCKQTYKLFNAKSIIKYYNIMHTFSTEEAVERMLDSINYQETDYLKQGIINLRNMIRYGQLKEYISKRLDNQFIEDGKTEHFAITKMSDGTKVYVFKGAGDVVVRSVEEENNGYILLASNPDIPLQTLRKCYKIDISNVRG